MKRSNEKNENVGVRRLTPTYAILTAVLLLVVSGCGQADTKHARHVRTIKAPYDINWIAWHPNGEELAGSGNFSKAVTIWNTRTGDVVREIVGDDGGVASLAYSPDGRYLAVGRGFTRLTRGHVHLSIYDAKTGVALRSFAPETPPSGTSNDVQAVAFSPDGRYVVASAYVGGNNAVVHDVESGKVVTILPGGPGRHSIYGLAYSPDGKTIAVGKLTGAPIPEGSHPATRTTTRDTIDVISTSDWHLVKTVTAHETTVHSLAFCGGSNFLVSGSSAVSAHYEKGTNEKIDRYRDPIKLWNADTFSVVQTFQSDLNAWVQSIGCTPDGKIMFAGGRDNAVEIWEVKTGQRIEWLEGFGINAYIHPSPDGKHFAVAAKKKVEIWELIR